MRTFTVAISLVFAVACAGNGSGAANNAAGAAGGAGTGGTGGSSAIGVTSFVQLPAGSRALSGVVNLVDAAAAQQLDDFIINDPTGTIFERHSLDKSLNLFLEHYEELYDFVFFLTDHPLPQTNTIGKFEPVTRPPLLGTGSDIGINADNYETNGRVKGVIGVQYLTGQFGPFAHEILHYWANYLDPKFGFDGPHWGFAGLHGQLGGFDPASLTCESPAGAAPPACTALPNGHIGYSVSAFGPNANGPNIAYAPFELYLMGLLPLAEVPPQISVLSSASVQPNVDPGTGSEIVEANGVQVVAVSDIVARHGLVPPLAMGERGFRAAFVVLSATPVSDELLSELESWSAIFGNREANPTLKSFEFVSGGRATLDTLLGARRPVTEAPPTIRPPFKCDLIHDDCAPAGAGLSCYLQGQGSFCALPGNATRGQPCTQGPDCIAHNECQRGMASASAVCEPHCDPNDATSPNACSKLCANFVSILNSDNQLLTGQCPAP